MKKKLIILGLTFVIISGFSSSKAFSENIMKVRIEFGLATRNCVGLGMCTIERWPSSGRKEEEMQQIDDNSFIGTITINTSNEVEFDIEKGTGITSEAYKIFFSAGYFLFEEDFIISKDLLENLGYTNEFIIRAGKYRIMEADQFIKLIIAG